MSILIIGGTGTLGRQIVKRALSEGYQVKCLVRNLRRSVFLRDWGAELIYGDLSRPETIPNTLKGVRVVIDASTVRSTDEYNSETIDWKGKIALLEASKVAKVKKYIFFTFYGATKNSLIPLLDLKIKFIKLLERSGIDYKVFQCEGFFQGLISQYAIPTLEKQTIWLLGEIPPSAYIDTQDAARIVVECLTKEKKSTLLGVKSWTPEEIIKLCERLSGQQAKTSYIPIVALAGLRTIFRSLQFTWNIADRLQFSEIAKGKQRVKQSIPATVEEDILSLEQYLQEYFSRILKKIKETNYQQSKQGNDISFL